MAVQSIESEDGNRPPIYVAKPLCANCGHEVLVQYCPNCGQHGRDHNISIWRFITEFFEEFAQVDSKFLRTVIPLVIRPGFLTSEWVRGKRARYITPLKVYITLSAIGFLAIGYSFSQNSKHLSHTVMQVNGNNKDALKELAVKPTDTPLEALMKTRSARLVGTDSKAFLEHCVSHLPTASLLTIPIAAFLIMLLYLRKGKFYVEHLVFMLHYNAFCFLLLTICFLIPNGALISLAYLWAGIYLFIAIKKNYGQGWVLTTLKFGMFSFAYTILLSLTAAGVVVVSFFLATEDPVDEPATPQKTISSAASKPDVKPAKTPMTPSASKTQSSATP